MMQHTLRHCVLKKRKKREKKEKKTSHRSLSGPEIWKHRYKMLRFKNLNSEKLLGKTLTV